MQTTLGSVYRIVEHIYPGTSLSLETIAYLVIRISHIRVLLEASY